MIKIVLQGLKITTGCRYLKFTLGNSIQIKEDYEKSVFEIIFPDDTESSDIVDDRIELISQKRLVKTDYKKVETSIINLNGLKLKRIVQCDYVFSQVIVENIEEFIINYDEDRCLVLIPKELNNDIEKYISLLRFNPFLEVIDYSELKSLNNYYNINFSKRSVTINSTNEFVFNTKEKYEKYLLSMTNVHASFIDQLKNILLDYGVELTDAMKTKPIKSKNYVVYQITEQGVQRSRKTDDVETLRYAVQHKSTFEFELSTPNIPILSNFKNKYQNLDLLTNFTTFYTKDKLGNDWISSIMWSPISAKFEHNFSRDQSGYHAFSATFSCELYYYIVDDVVFNNINEMVFDLLAVDKENKISWQNSFTKILK